MGYFNKHKKKSVKSLKSFKSLKRCEKKNKGFFVTNKEDDTVEEAVGAIASPIRVRRERIESAIASKIALASLAT